MTDTTVFMISFLAFLTGTFLGVLFGLYAEKPRG